MILQRIIAVQNSGFGWNIRRSTVAAICAVGLMGDGFKRVECGGGRFCGNNFYAHIDRAIIRYAEATDEFGAIGHGADQLGKAGKF